MQQAEKVKTAFRVDGSRDRIVLFYWGLSGEPRYRNIARVDRRGVVLWRADLPTDVEHDCFVRLDRRGDGFVAATYSGQEVWLDADGRVNEQDLRTAA